MQMKRLYLVTFVLPVSNQVTMTVTQGPKTKRTERAAVNGSDRTTSMAQTREFDALTIRDLGACHDDDSINVQTHLKKSAQ